MRFEIPQKVNEIIETLIQNGFEAYAVGGCVRDMVLLRDPQDWDITTSATPFDVKKIFRRTVDTGIQHGTVTVLLEQEHFEVTTYRVDGAYEDNRHPKEVLFTACLMEDLKRRDFTINAMAYNERDGLIDPFGGVEDLKRGVIRCVGKAEERFDEDALRILRAIRFCAQLDFKIEENTLKAVADKAQNLQNISAERIRVELTKLLISDHPDRLRLLYRTGITGVVLPEFDAMMTTDQKSKYHIYSVGEHTIHTVETVGGEWKEGKFLEWERMILRWTMLLHDIEKPNTISVDEEGQNHFYGHPEKGAETAQKILKRLKFDNDTIGAVVHLIRWHDYQFTLTPSGMRKAVSKIGKEYMKLLFEVNRADATAKNPENNGDQFEMLESAGKLYEDIKRKEECVSLKELKVNGNDLIDAGFHAGRELGELLNWLLDLVMEDPLRNDKETLIKLAKEAKDGDECFAAAPGRSKPHNI
jgi:tRNA nucleotidyltransferase (CCA-adding enzyme)